MKDKRKQPTDNTLRAAAADIADRLRVLSPTRQRAFRVWMRRGMLRARRGC